MFKEYLNILLGFVLIQVESHLRLGAEGDQTDPGVTGSDRQLVHYAEYEVLNVLEMFLAHTSGGIQQENKVRVVVTCCKMISTNINVNGIEIYQKNITAMCKVETIIILNFQRAWTIHFEHPSVLLQFCL